MNAITTHAPEPAMLGFLQRAVSDPNFDTNKFEVVLGAVREEQAKHAEREFYRSMAEAQNEMEPVRRDALNPHTRKRYATLEAVDGQLRPIYTRHGFSVSYRTGTPTSPGSVRMICTVAHASGHIVEAELEAALDGSGSGGRNNKTDVQATGSTVSYLRRYLLNMVFNVALASEDDDGEGSRAAPRQQERQPQRPPQRAETDQTLNGDQIHGWDAPPPPKPDRLRKAANRIKELLSEAADADAYNKLMSHEGIKAEWEKIKAERPELAEELEAHRTAELDRIAAEPAEQENAG